MRDGQREGGALIDVSSISLQELHTMESAALRAALASCLTQDEDFMARFENSI